MSNEDYRQGYKDGFKDGIEEGKKQVDKTWLDGYMEGLKQATPPPYNPNEGINLLPIIPDLWPRNSNDDHCPKCGLKLTSPMGYVCHSPNCPTFPRATSGTKSEPLSFTTGQHSVVDPSGSSNMKYEYQKEDGASYASYGAQGAVGSDYNGIGRYGP